MKEFKREEKVQREDAEERLHLPKSLHISTIFNSTLPPVTSRFNLHMFNFSLTRRRFPI